MISVPAQLQQQYDQLLINIEIAPYFHPHYKKWLRFYLDFCSKYNHSSQAPSSLPYFIQKLTDKNQPEPLRLQAQHAIHLYYSELNSTPSKAINRTQPQQLPPTPKINPSQSVSRRQPPPPNKKSDADDCTAPVDKINIPPMLYAETPAPQSATISEPPPSPNRTTKIHVSWVSVYDSLSQEIALRHYSPKTLKAYRQWIRQFQGFLKSKDPTALKQQDAKDFLGFLVIEKAVAASTQNQAFNALLFLYKNVLDIEFGTIKGVARAKKSEYIPVVLSRAEVDRVIANLPEPYDLATKLLYGCGLRLSECLDLRLQDFNFDANLITVRNGKGNKGRTVPLPMSIKQELQRQIERAIELHHQDIENNYGGVFMPDALGTKYPNAAKEVSWQWFFPAKILTFVADSNHYKRYHLHDSHLQKAIKKAVNKSKLIKRATAHTFRHSFASHLLQANYDIHTIQVLLGHSDIRTTLIYLKTVPSTTIKEAQSPLDFTVDVA